MGGSRSHLDKKKNCPKIKFCVCTIRPCLAVHVAPQGVHACSNLSRILWFCDSIAVRLTKWCISLTCAMLFAPVHKKKPPHGGCYIISSVGIEYSCGLSVMWCILSVYDLSDLALSRMGFQKKNWIGGWVGGWVELYPNFVWIFGIFLTLQSPLPTKNKMNWIDIVHGSKNQNVEAGRSHSVSNSAPSKLIFTIIGKAHCSNNLFLPWDLHKTGHPVL